MPKNKQVKNRRGGARDGAGRPKGKPKKQYTIRLTEKAAAHIDGQDETPSEIIEDLIMASKNGK